MTMIIDGTNGLTFNNATTQASGGKVLQVVYAKVLGGTTTSTSFVDTGLTASITPKFATSTILVSPSIPGNGVSVNGLAAQYELYRNGSSIATIDYDGCILIGSTVSQMRVGTTGFDWQDSPATTSSVTYNVQVKVRYGSGTIVWAGSGGSYITMTLMEIAA